MKTSHEMAQSVLEKRNKILRRRRILTTSLGTLAGTAAVAGVMLLTLNIAKPQGVDLVDSNTSPDVITDLPINVSSGSPLELIGAEINSDGKYVLDISGWEVLNEYDIFREHFFGTWDDPRGIFGASQFTFDDTENDAFVKYGIVWFRDFYKVSDNVYAFIADGNAVSWLFWVDMTAPDTMYWEMFNGDLLFDHTIHGTDIMTRVDSSHGEPENGFLSVYRLREMSQEYGIGLDTLLDFEYDIGKPDLLYHDRNAQFYPVYLVSDAEDTLVFRTKVGNVMTREELPVVYTLSKNGGEWLLTDLSVEEETMTTPLSQLTDFSAADIPDIPSEERGLQAMGAEMVLLDTKPAGELSVLLIGDYVTTDSANYPGMVNCFNFEIALSDGANMGELCGATSQFVDTLQGGYWLYTDRLADYADVFQFGGNYIIVLRYYGSNGSSVAAFYAIKDGVLYPTLMGDYSPVGGVQMAMVTELSENLTADARSCVIRDEDNGLLFAFDFDAIGDTFTGVHYEVHSCSNDDYWVTQEADTKYDDDDTVPENWLPVKTAAEALRSFDEITDADTSGGDISEVICSLADRNVLFFETMLGHTFDIDWNSPYAPENSTTLLYPISSQYFSDLDSIYKLAYSTYNSSTADELLFGTNKTRPLFSEENGKLYVNADALSNWSADPFAARSYIEITGVSGSQCTFIWHYPDREGLNPPKEHKYFYYDKQYNALYIDGEWVLDGLILNNYK